MTTEPVLCDPPAIQSVRKFRWRGLVGATVLLPASLLVILSRPLIQEGTWLNILFVVLGWGTFLGGTIWRFWATLYIGGRKSGVVVCQGPYSICRNPLYVGTFLLQISIAFFLASPLLAVAVVGVAIFYIRATVPAEEAFLTTRLGEPYLQYLQDVPRFWPRWSRFWTPEVLEVHTAGLRREAWRAVRWIGLPIAAAILAHLRVQSWWPDLLSLPWS